MAQHLYHILVVEDNIEHQRLIASIFDKTEISVDFASSGEKAEQFITSIQYHMIVIDLILPDTHGFDLLKYVKSDYPALPAIVISAFGNERDTVDAIKLGAENYVSKSLGFEQRLHDVVISTLQHKQLLTKVSLAEERYKTLFDSANDIMFTLDLDGKFTSINQKCNDFFDQRRVKSIIGKSFTELIFPANQLKKAQELFYKVLYENDSTTLYDFELSDKNGNKLILEINASVLLEKGKSIGLLCVGRDVTRIVNLSAQQKKMQFHMMDRHRLAAVGNMVQGVAHNLSTPLASIMGYAELLQMKEPTSAQLQLIIEQCNLMNEIVRSMVNKGTQDNSDKKEYWDINKIIKDELKFFESNSTYKHEITRSLELAKNLPKINIVYHHFSQAFDAFIQNSIDAMYFSKTKKLTISTSLINNMIQMKICDTGHGIPESLQKQIYEPFFTTKKTNVVGNEPTGVGLGLFQAYTLMEPHGIIFECESTKEQTTFTWNIPIPDVEN